MSAIATADTRPALASLHKISDAADLRQPYFEGIVRETLGFPFMILGQRVWEFAVAYGALERAGALAGDRVGVSFGAGFEWLLYAVSRRVRTLHAIDLYDEHSIWDEARARDARAELDRRAPIPWNPDAVEIARMDMRSLDFPDQMFDFAYSISTIEHIGEREDFVSHLREARRVLKPGGVYVLTTTLVLLPETIRQPGCVLFAEPELRDMIREGGFSAPGPLDVRLSDDAGNTPTFPKGSLELPMFVDEMFVPRVHVLFRSEPYAACCLVLRAGNAAPAPAPDAAATADARRRLLALRDRYVDAVWSQPTRVAPRFYDDFLLLHPSYFVHTECFAFGAGAFRWTIELGSRRAPFKGTVLLFVQSAPTADPGAICHEGQTIVAVDLVPGQRTPIEIPFTADADTGYALVARVEEGVGAPDWVEIRASRHLPWGDAPPLL